MVTDALTNLGGGPLPSTARLKLLAVATVLTALCVAAGILLVRFVANEWQRELQIWQVRLGIVADSRFAAVDGWLDRQFDEIATLADNPALQLYVTQLAVGDAGEDAADIAEAQGEYLRNLLEATAVRTGFAGRAAGTTVGANIERSAGGGIALIDAKGQTLAATEGMPPLVGRLRDFMAGLVPGERNLLDLHLNASGRPTMAFAIPVFAVQGNRDAASQIGVVVGVREVGDDLFGLLRQPGDTDETAQTLLVRRDGAAVEYLSRLPDGTAPLSLRLAANTADLDAAFAVDAPGGFGQRRDYRGRDVLVTGREFAKAPWTLMHTIERKEALGPAQSRLTWLALVGVISMILIVASFVVVWRHGSLRRAAESAAGFREMAARIEDQRNLLRLVTDSQPTGIYILDADGTCRFANREAARNAGIPAEDMAGKPIVNILGPEAAKRHLSANRKVLESGAAVAEFARVNTAEGTRVLQIEHIPVAPSHDMPSGVLVVERDITDVVTERERRTRTLSQIVRTLVGVVDRRDPYAANHSQRVAALARALAVEMNLPERDIDAVETAGNLLNFGKILVAPELLTKSGEMSDEDRQKVRQSIQTSAELLNGIEFDGPVVDTLRQAQARTDGSGIPAGLAGDNILLTARIVSVANAFVGMVSKRAYRDALDLDRAVDAMLSQVGKAFDRRVVAALINYLDNRGGRAQWAAGDQTQR